jgi:hypothetical protein
MAAIDKIFCMKKIVIAISLVFICFEASFSQIAKGEDTLSIKIILRKNGGAETRQLIRIIYQDSAASITFYDKHKVQLVPQDGLDKEQLSIAEVLINAKDLTKLPEQYKRYLSVPDSPSILKLVESYGVERSYNQSKPTTLDCLRKCKEWLTATGHQNARHKSKKETKVVFREKGMEEAYYLGKVYNSQDIFKCLFY